MSSTIPSTLPRRLGLWAAVAIVIGTTIGSGIFRSPAAIANRLPEPIPYFGVWIAGGLFALCGALTLAEVAGALPRTGGVYVFIRDGWGRLPAFLFGWAELIIIRAAALGAISTPFAEYLLRLLGFDPAVAPYSTWVHFVAAGAIAVVAFFNYIGVRSGAAMVSVTTIAKYGGLLFIAILGLALGLPRYGVSNFTASTASAGIHASAFGLALVSALWVFDGWADLTFIGGEIKDPRRNLPRALILGTLAVLGIYLLANVAYVTVMPLSEIRRSPLVAADVAERLIGAAGVAFVSTTVLLSTFGTLNGSILTSPRIFFAMAEDGLFFRTFAKVHPRFETPHVAIALTAVLGMAFILITGFERLADAFVTAIVPFYALGVAAIFPLRRRADYDPSFRVPLYPVLPVVFVLGTLYLLINALLSPGGRWTMVVFGAILVGIPVYFATVGRRRASEARSSL